MEENFSEILVYFLTLRQTCSHISLHSKCLDLNELQKLKSETVDVETMMGNLNLDNTSKSLEQNSLCNGINDLDTSVGSNYLSAKLSKLLEMVDDITKNHEEDKIIIVSEWTSLLNIVGYYLKGRDLKFYEVRGDVNPHQNHHSHQILFKEFKILQTFNS
jgi:SNF2 family DNA or RNA helicase